MRHRYLLTTLASVVMLTAQAKPGLEPKPDALLQIDMNRGAVVERIVSAWSAEVPSAQMESLKSKLMGLRADQLLAANLSGSFDGVLEVINRKESKPELLPASFANAAAFSSDEAKALGDANVDLAYTPITPCNLMDTRPGVSPVPPITGPALAPGYAIRNVQVTGNCALPAATKAVMALFTVENNPSAGGVVFAGPSGGTGGAVVSWTAPSVYASGSGVVPLSAAGQMQIQSAGSTQIKVDIVGYMLQVTRGNISNSVAGGSVFQVTNTNTASSSTAVRGISTATGLGGIGVWGSHAGGGYGVLGQAGANGSGVFAQAGANGSGVNASAGTDGYGVFASAPIGTGAAVYADGDLKVAPEGALSFNSQTRQMINLWGPSVYGIGVQAGTQYFRTDSNAAAGTTGGFAWFEGGAHDDNAFNAGAGGSTLLRLTRAKELVWGDPAATQNGEFLQLNATDRRTIGSQSSTLYFRSNGTFCWYFNGTHVDTFCAPGSGGTTAMQLDTSGLRVNGTLLSTSDREKKQAFKSVDVRDVLKRVVAMPISSWVYKNDSATRHIGPVAQDFKRLFGVGVDDKTISMVDADGVALAAIQGLNQLMKEKDAKIGSLEKANENMQRELAAIKKKLGL